MVPSSRASFSVRTYLFHSVIFSQELRMCLQGCFLCFTVTGSKRMCVSVSHHTSAPIAHAASTWRQKLSLPGFILSSQEPLYSGTSRTSGEHSNTSMWCTMASLPAVTTDSYWQTQREAEKETSERERVVLFSVFLLAESYLRINRNISEMKRAQYTVQQLPYLILLFTFHHITYTRSISAKTKIKMRWCVVGLMHFLRLMLFSPTMTMRLLFCLAQLINREQ